MINFFSPFQNFLIPPISPARTHNNVTACIYHTMKAEKVPMQLILLVRQKPYWLPCDDIMTIGDCIYHLVSYNRVHSMQININAVVQVSRFWPIFFHLLSPHCAWCMFGCCSTAFKAHTIIDRMKLKLKTRIKSESFSMWSLILLSPIVMIKAYVHCTHTVGKKTWLSWLTIGWKKKRKRNKTKTKIITWVRTHSVHANGLISALLSYF